jgi:hypothetical protein
MAERFDPAADAKVSWTAKFAGGIVAGLLAAVLMMGLLIAYSIKIGEGPTMPLKSLGALVYGVEALIAGNVAIASGAAIQLGFSLALGILFGLVMSRRTPIMLGMLLGIAVGIAIWVAMNLYVLPFMDPTMAARVALMPTPYFVAHVLLGVGLGMTPLLIRAFSPRPGRRPERLEEPLEHLTIRRDARELSEARR